MSVSVSVSITISLSISISVSISGYFGFINNLLVFLITFWFHKPCGGRRPRRPAYGTSQRINNHTLSNTPTVFRDSLFRRKIATLGAG
ncbi:hypothetical protein DWW71_09075 [Ruminococcus sp. AF16-50]|nr:hypothetical protein DWW71_09075 [Ruminococcus sp. AF16-50]